MKTATGAEPMGVRVQFGFLGLPPERQVRLTTWERFHTGGCNPSAFNCVVVGERCDSSRSHLIYVLGVTPWLLQNSSIAMAAAC